MSTHARNLLITFVVLTITHMLVSDVSLGIEERMGTAIGIALVPLFNSHLFVKYIDSKFIKKNQFLSMFLITSVSMYLINSVLVTIVILCAMLANYLLSKKTTLEETENKT